MSAPASDYLDALNSAQRDAAIHGRREGPRFRSGPLLIIAGAGTGKTMTLAHRVAHLVMEGVAPERILLLTFTRRAAREVSRRARRIVSFHAFEGTPGNLPEIHKQIRDTGADIDTV